MLPQRATPPHPDFYSPSAILIVFLSASEESVCSLFSAPTPPPVLLSLLCALGPSSVDHLLFYFFLILGSFLSAHKHSQVSPTLETPFFEFSSPTPRQDVLCFSLFKQGRWSEYLERLSGRELEEEVREGRKLRRGSVRMVSN